MIVLSLGFESVQEALRDYFEREQKDVRMLDTAFKEITVLGFISLFVSAPKKLDEALCNGVPQLLLTRF